MKLSPAAIAQLVNHDQWPKSIDKQELWGRMADWLYDVGAQDGDIAALEEEGSRAPTRGDSCNPETNHETRSAPTC